MRKVIHVDMDCFYAAIECRDEPSIAHLPVGVGGSSGRGVLTTCNYVARAYGCRSAMPVFQARELCPQLILKPVRFDLYRRESARIRAIFADYTDLIEPLSLDEAYLDVTAHPDYAWTIARDIRRRIREELDLTASAGIAANKMLAKIASDWRKPDGQFAVLPEEVEAFMRDLPVRKLPGVGPRAQERLAEHGIETCGDLQDVPLHHLTAWFGPAWAGVLVDRARGIDERPVESSRERKSMSCEHTFSRNLETYEQCRERLLAMIGELSDDLAGKDALPAVRKVFVKVKFADFRSTTRERPALELEPGLIEELLREAHGRSAEPVRLLGLGVRFATAPEEDHRQLLLPLGETAG
ncbi:MAG: DNA polymerase IV [Opitutales bacterium]